MRKVTSKAALAAGLLVSSIAVVPAVHAASVYAVSINEITDFSMSFVGAGSGTVGGFTINYNTAETTIGTQNMGFTDASPSCIGCDAPYNNDFTSHSQLTSFAYGDTLIASSNVAGGTGAASAIAEAYVTSGTGSATATNELTGNFNVTGGSSQIQFSFNANPFLQLDINGGINATASMSMDILIDNILVDSFSLASINLSNELDADGTYTYDQTLGLLGGTTTDSYSGSHNITLRMSQAVAVSAVPVPAAVWLFGSGLLGLVGVARRKRQ